MDNNEITIFAQTNFRKQAVNFGIKKDDRRRHMYVLGKTGMGKTNLLETMIIQDIQEGKGVAVVDPHGELAEKIIRFVPPHRINDVIYFNPADMDYPIAFNVLEKVTVEHRHLVASGLLGVFQKIWADSWGPRLEYVLNNAILALLEYPDSTLLGIMKMLVDKEFRKKVMKKITDPVVKSFWIDEYSKYPDRFQAEAIAPIQNKVGRFLSSSMMRNIVGQVKSSIDIRKIMDEKKILILNLSKGRIGEDNSSLLGSMIVTKIQLATMSRVEIPEKERNDFYLYVDEFQNFATESFANILSEARKYRLNLIMAHQYILQLSETVRAAVFGNVGSIICFRVGAEDAEFLVKEFTPRFDETDLVNLSKYTIYLKLMIEGLSSEPFSATTLPPLSSPENAEETAEKIINSTRERYATKRQIIEEKIIRWSGTGEEEEESKRTENIEDKKRIRTSATKRNNYKEAYQTSTNQRTENNKYQCDACGQETYLNFIPDPNKPIYCKKCLKKVKEQRQLPRTNRTPLEKRTINTPEISLKEAISSPVAKFKNKKPTKIEESPQKLNPGEVVKF
ncbi:type IV secretion system DNA-binding domain-containing protein [Patescibacteria group bacterium]|nr:type IV secretion system DNA-binding domain-containing protein [Patescibacteria group bacterium]